MPTVTDEPTPKQPPDVAAVQTHQARPRRLRKNVIFGLMAILAGIAILAFSAAILETPTQLSTMEGVDLWSYAGYTDRVDNHWKRLIGAVVLSSVFAAAPTATVGNGNSSDFNRPVGDEVARSIGANIQRAGDQIVSKNLNIQPTLMVGPGYAVNILVKKDLVLAPYTVYRGSDIAFGRTANEPRRTLP